MLERTWLQPATTRKNLMPGEQPLGILAIFSGLLLSLFFGIFAPRPPCDAAC
jgi:hypothetical protein